MINFGEMNSLTIVRKADFGCYLDAGTGRTGDDILLPNSNVEDQVLGIGDVVEAFIYRDSKDRPVATLKKPLAMVGDIAYLEVVAITSIGAFIYFGLERDILVPIKEQKFRLIKNKKYLFYIYLDKSGRIAATTDIDRYLDTSDEYTPGDDVTGIAYGYQTNGSVLVAVDNKFKGVILKNEYFEDINPGEELHLRVKKYYEDGTIGLTPRQGRMYERDIIEQKILDYLSAHGGAMRLNDKSSPEDIKQIFGTSKNYFKNALGGLMKKGLIIQTENETKLK
jgi:predicted RNA-binding protein (virulence factor B family)